MLATRQIKIFMMEVVFAWLTAMELYYHSSKFGKIQISSLCLSYQKPKYAGLNWNKNAKRRASNFEYDARQTGINRCGRCTIAIKIKYLRKYSWWILKAWTCRLKEEFTCYLPTSNGWHWSCYYIKIMVGMVNNVYNYIRFDLRVVPWPLYWPY